jgi:hypothetical protein
MVGPVEGHVCCVLEDIVVGMAHHDYVAVAFATFWAEGLEGVLCVFGVASQRSLHYHQQVLMKRDGRN